jgi:hypothetical protein
MVQITSEGHIIRPGVSRESLLSEPVAARAVVKTS